MDLHAAQIQGFFDIPVDHLTAAPVLLDYFKGIRKELGDCTVVSPDVGNVKVANMYADLLDCELAIIDKRRRSGDDIVMNNLIGEVDGRTVLMFDDMISTAGTICSAANLVIEHGATDVMAACTHPVMVGLAMQRLADSPISKIIVTNSIPDGNRFDPLKKRIISLPISQLLAEAVHRIHHDMSISALFRRAGGTKR